MKKSEKIKYEKIFNGTIVDKNKIARRFKENFDILENLKKWRKYNWTISDLSLWDYASDLFLCLL